MQGRIEVGRMLLNPAKNRKFERTRRTAFCFQKVVRRAFYFEARACCLAFSEQFHEWIVLCISGPGPGLLRRGISVLHKIRPRFHHLVAEGIILRCHWPPTPSHCPLHVPELRGVGGRNGFRILSRSKRRNLYSYGDRPISPQNFASVWIPPAGSRSFLPVPPLACSPICR